MSKNSYVNTFFHRFSEHQDENKMSKINRKFLTFTRLPKKEPLAFSIAAPSPKASESLENDENEQAVLVLKTFQKIPFVNFNKVFLGESKSKKLMIQNPAHVPQSVTVIRVPDSKTGFELKDMVLYLLPNQELFLEINWRPQTVAKYREKIHLINSFNEKFEVILLGNSVVKSQAKKRTRPLWSTRKPKLPLQVIKERENKQTQTSPFLANTLFKKKECQTLIKQISCDSNSSNLETAASKIQKAWRTYRFRKNLKNPVKDLIFSPPRKLRRTLTPTSNSLKLFKDMNQAAVTIQKAFKKYTLIKKKKKEEAALIIQRTWKKYKYQRKNASFTFNQTYHISASQILQNEPEKISVNETVTFSCNPASANKKVLKTQQNHPDSTKDGSNSNFDKGLSSEFLSIFKDHMKENNLTGLNHLNDSIKSKKNEADFSQLQPKSSLIDQSDSFQFFKPSFFHIDKTFHSFESGDYCKLTKNDQINKTFEVGKYTENESNFELIKKFEEAQVNQVFENEESKLEKFENLKSTTKDDQNSTKDVFQTIEIKKNDKRSEIIMQNVRILNSPEDTETISTDVETNETQKNETQEKVEIEIEVDEAQTNKDDEDAHSDSMEFRVTDYKETNKLIEEKNVSEKRSEIEETEEVEETIVFENESDLIEEVAQEIKTECEQMFINDSLKTFNEKILLSSSPKSSNTSDNFETFVEIDEVLIKEEVKMLSTSLSFFTASENNSYGSNFSFVDVSFEDVLKSLLSGPGLIANEDVKEVGVEVKYKANEKITENKITENKITENKKLNDVKVNETCEETSNVESKVYNVNKLIENKERQNKKESELTKKDETYEASVFETDMLVTVKKKVFEIQKNENVAALSKINKFKIVKEEKLKEYKTDQRLEIEVVTAGEITELDEFEKVEIVETNKVNSTQDLEVSGNVIKVNERTEVKDEDFEVQEIKPKEIFEIENDEIVEQNKLAEVNENKIIKTIEANKKVANAEEVKESESAINVDKSFKTEKLKNSTKEIKIIKTDDLAANKNKSFEIKEDEKLTKKTKNEFDKTFILDESHDVLEKTTVEVKASNFEKLENEEFNFIETDNFIKVENKDFEIEKIKTNEKIEDLKDEKMKVVNDAKIYELAKAVEVKEAKIDEVNELVENEKGNFKMDKFNNLTERKAKDFKTVNITESNEFKEAEEMLQIEFNDTMELFQVEKDQVKNVNQNHQVKNLENIIALKENYSFASGKSKTDEYFESCLNLSENRLTKENKDDQPINKNSALETIKLSNSCILIQKFFRGFLARKQFKAVIKSIIFIQKTWRGYRVRKHLFQDDCFKKIFQKVKISNENATKDMTLGKRTSSAYQKLIHYKNFNHLNCELESLELTTRMSPESCITIASERTVKTLEQIINKSNRSEPNKFILYYSFGILINLIKFEKTSIYVQNQKTLIETCLKFSKIHHRFEKILNKCLTLLYILISTHSNQQSIVQNPKFRLNWERFLKLDRLNFTKPKKGYRNINFYPEWCIANNIEYEFVEENRAIYAISLLFNIKPKKTTK